MEIAAITKIFEKPILLKNVVNSMRIESLVIFLIIHFYSHW